MESERPISVAVEDDAFKPTAQCVEGLAYCMWDGGGPSHPVQGSQPTPTNFFVVVELLRCHMLGLL